MSFGVGLKLVLHSIKASLNIATKLLGANLNADGVIILVILHNDKLKGKNKV